MTFQERYDDALFDCSVGEYDAAIGKLRALLAERPDDFDAQLSLGMACFRKGDVAMAIAEGHKAERLRPTDPFAHTNLSQFYLKSGDKQKAEHHGAQARIASWKSQAPPLKPPPGG